MKYPKFLEENGTIGFVAPSFGCNIEPYHTTFNNALKTWQRLGFETRLGPNCYEGKGLGISNTPQACADELTQAMCDEESDALISCGGGELMCEILPYMDFDAVKKAAPKWFMGYSDNTNMTFLLNTLCDTAAVYGPCAPAFGMEPWHPALTSAMEILMGKSKQVRGYLLWEKESLKSEENPLVPYHVTEPKIIKKFPNKDVSLTGRLLGGCLDCLSNLVGTRFDKVGEFNKKYKQDGIIWFLESCDLNPMAIRRAIWQLKEAGWFENTKGFLIGRPYCFGEEVMGVNQYNAVTDLLEEFQVPVIMDVDLGHLPPAMPIVSGSMANVTVINNDITIDYNFA